MNIRINKAPVSLALIKAVFTSPNVPQLFRGEETHEPALAFVNELLPHVQDTDRILPLVRAALPETYDGNTLQEVPELVASRLKKGMDQRNRSFRAYDPGEDGPMPLGYLEDGRYVVFDQLRHILVVETSNRLIQEGTLINLAPMSSWLERFPRFKDGQVIGVDAKLAGDTLIRACRAKGGFDTALVRGRGVYKDGRDRVIVNWGSEPPEDLRFVYVCHLPIEFPAGDGAEADPAKVLAFFERFNWSAPSSAHLLLGWTVTAVICGVLDWRPHVFLTGAKNTGKTTLILALQNLLRSVAVVLDGQSTEAGIRQKVGADSRPVILDEFESDQNLGRMKSVVKLVRSASSASYTIARGTPEGKALEFCIRSSFLLAAINPIMVTAADRSRIVVLGLDAHNNEKDVAAAIQRDLRALEGASEAWCKLVIDNIPNILASIDTLLATFPPVESRHAKNMATLLGAAWAILHEATITESEAEDLIEVHRAAIDELAGAHEENDSAVNGGEKWDQRGGVKRDQSGFRPCPWSPREGPARAAACLSHG